MEKYSHPMKMQFLTKPVPVPALAGSGTPELGLPSTRSHGYVYQSSPAPSRTCSQPSSGILVQCSADD
jgi:hypothetical protein